MNCREVRSRLVALDDGELSPGEQAQVREHLARCHGCSSLHQRLAAVEPRPTAWVSPVAQLRMEQALCSVRLMALAAEAPATKPRAPWLVREARIPAGAMVAYALMLVVAVAWGLSNWATARSLELALEQQVAPVELVPVEQFVPASWSPTEPQEHPRFPDAQPSDDEDLF